MEEKKRVLVIGTGAIGGYVGGFLTRAGHDVVFLCRPATGARIRADGIEIRAGEEAFVAHPDVVLDAAECFSAGRPDLIICTVKRYDTRAAVETLLPFVNDLPPVLDLQNGIGAAEDLVNILGVNNHISGTVTTAVGRPDANRIVVERFRGIGIAGSHPEARYWADEMMRIGLGGQYFEDADQMKWSKLLTNLSPNPASAILDMAPSEIFAHPGLFRLEMMQLREALAVMRRKRIQVVDLPGAPVRLLAFCAHLPRFIAQPLLKRALGKGRGGKMPSFHVDLHSGSGKSEIGYLHGAVVKEGSRMGIKTPVNELLVEILTAMTAGQLDPKEFKRRPERLLRR